MAPLQLELLDRVRAQEAEERGDITNPLVDVMVMVQETTSKWRPWHKTPVASARATPMLF